MVGEALNVSVANPWKLYSWSTDIFKKAIRVKIDESQGSLSKRILFTVLTPETD